MALKYSVTKEEHGKLSEELRGQYVEDKDGYRLDLDGESDNGALKRSKDREVQLRKDTEAENKKLAEQLAELMGNDARKRGDIEALEKSWKEKSDKTASEAQTQIQKLRSLTERNLRDNVALAAVSKITSSPELLLPHFLNRLQVDFESDEPRTRVVDAKGQPSAATIDELVAEFVADKKYSAIITASKASGGAGTSTMKTGSAQNYSSNDKNKGDYAKMSVSELRARIEAKKQR